MKKALCCLLLIMICGCSLADNTNGEVNGRWQSPAGIDIRIIAPKVKSPKYNGKIKKEGNEYIITLNIGDGLTSTYIMTLEDENNGVLKKKGSDIGYLIKKTSD